MPRTTVTLNEDHAETLAEVREDHALDSRAAAVRHCIEQHPDIDRLESELHERDVRVRELREQLMNANSRIDTANELVEAVDERRTLERRRASAGVLTRVKWWAFGMGDE